MKASLKSAQNKSFDQRFYKMRAWQNAGPIRGFFLKFAIMLVAFSSKAGISAPTIGNNAALFLNMLVDKIVQAFLRAISYNLQPYAAKLFAVLFYRNGNSTFMLCRPSSFASAFLSTNIK